MKHGELGHFLVYHFLPVILIYGVIIGLIGGLVYRHKSKKHGAKAGKKEMPDDIQFLHPVRSGRKRRQKKR